MMLRVRLALGVIGLGTAVAGVLTGDRRLVWVAIAALSAAIVLRIWSRRGPRG
jgi:hypothetical protein